VAIKRTMQMVQSPLSLWYADSLGSRTSSLESKLVAARDFRVRKGVVGVEESVWRKEERLRGGLRGLGGKPGTPLIEAPPVSFGERERGASAKGRGFPCSLHRALFSTGPNLTPA
jgi:hypothetical protein